MTRHHLVEKSHHEHMRKSPSLSVTHVVAAVERSEGEGFEGWITLFEDFERGFRVWRRGGVGLRGMWGWEGR